jgi:tRNA(adenine34) deaminase
MNEKALITDEERLMCRALELAQTAAILGEVPVGAVIVKDGEIISEAYNRRELDKNALAHAELIAIDAACKKLGGWRLHQCELYVTLEPCPMCAGAIVNSRLKRVIIGASDPKAGALGSVLNLNFYPLNHRPDIVFGVCEKESRELLRTFFSNIRVRKTDRN